MKTLALLFAATMFAGIATAQKNFTLTSQSVGGQGTPAQEFNGFGCTGRNQSPQLSWTNPPEGTGGYAITMYDKDAPTGSGWWHWVAFNIPAGTTSLPMGAGSSDPRASGASATSSATSAGSGGMPAGTIQSRTDFGTTGYGGPCPPQGDAPHQYVITVYALKDDKLNLDENASPAQVSYAINQRALGKASIIFYYQR